MARCRAKGHSALKPSPGLPAHDGSPNSPRPTHVRLVARERHPERPEHLHEGTCAGCIAHPTMTAHGLEGAVAARSTMIEILALTGHKNLQSVDLRYATCCRNIEKQTFSRLLRATAQKHAMKTTAFHLNPAIDVCCRETDSRFDYGPAPADGFSICHSEASTPYNPVNIKTFNGVCVEFSDARGEGHAAHANGLA
jgi:hypothetical protein